MTNQKTAIDLFSGCGGLSWGLKKAGFELIGAVELDTLAATTYQLNFPKAAVLQEDITTVSPKAFRKQLGLKKGELSLLAGCPPCQGFSTLRTHHRSSSVAKEPMNDLIFRVLDFVREFEPKAVMIENVPGLSKDIRIQNFQKGLEKLGYQCGFEVHNAKDYGTPQKRKRMIFIGLKGQVPVFAKANKKQKSVKDAISNMPAPEQSNDPMHNYGVK